MSMLSANHSAARSSSRTVWLTGLLALFLVLGTTGCDTFGDVFGNEQEANVTLEEVNVEESFVVGDGIRYDVDGDTEFEGVDGLSDLSTGDQVGIEYEDSGDNRRALEIETGSDDDDGGLF